MKQAHQLLVQDLKPNVLLAAPEYASLWFLAPIPPLALGPCLQAKQGCTYPSSTLSLSPSFHSECPEIHAIPAWAHASLQTEVLGFCFSFFWDALVPRAEMWTHGEAGAWAAV